jgi:hypothetical protein
MFRLEDVMLETEFDPKDHKQVEKLLRRGAEYSRVVSELSLLSIQYIDGAITEKEFADTAVLRLAKVNLNG